MVEANVAVWIKRSNDGTNVQNLIRNLLTLRLEEDRLWWAVQNMAQLFAVSPFPAWALVFCSVKTFSLFSSYVTTLETLEAKNKQAVLRTLFCKYLQGVQQLQVISTLKSNYQKQTVGNQLTRPFICVRMCIRFGFAAEEKRLTGNVGDRTLHRLANWTNSTIRRGDRLPLCAQMFTNVLLGRALYIFDAVAILVAMKGSIWWGKINNEKVQKAPSDSHLELFLEPFRKLPS